MVGMNVYLSNKTARYIQVGIQNKKGFSGYIRDYVGGGEYQEFYFINGEIQEDSFDYQDLIYELNNMSPKLYGNSIEKYLNDYLKYQESLNVYKPSPLFKSLFKKKDLIDGAILYIGKELELIEVGNSFFI